MDLLRAEGAALGNDDPSVLPVYGAALDGTVVQIGHAHIGPIDVTRLRIDRDAVGVSAIGDDDLLVGAVGIHRMNAAAAQLENE
jgi:hypothetical protein